MKMREEIFDIYLNQYTNDVTVMKIRNPLYVPDEQSIVNSIAKTGDMYRRTLPEIDLTEDEKDLVIKRIKSVHSVYQEEGSALLGDYEHDYKWYENFLNEGNEEYYWQRYKNYLAVQKHFPSKVIYTLEQDTLRKIMSYLGNPNEANGFSIRVL